MEQIIMLLEEIKSKLKDRNIKSVAEAIGVHYNTLYKIINGLNEPNHSTYSKLVEYLKG